MRFVCLCAFLSACAANPPAFSPTDGPASDGSASGGPTVDGSTPAPPADGGTPTPPGDGGGTAPTCQTRVTYGQAWIRPAQHPSSSDLADGAVTWDGTCTDDGSNSYAVLSNGWKPYFTGHAACVIALDESNCSGAPTACTTRVRYGPGWLQPANHPASYDDVTGRLISDGVCRADGSNSFEQLSNGWAPHFSGANACALSFSYQQCGGLFANPIINHDCPDPGVSWDGAEYVLSCTSGNAADAFPLYVSPDLVSFTQKGHILPQAAKPAWAQSDFWAPEIHHVGNHWVAYFSARNSDGKLSIGAASSASPTGPFVALGHPLVHDANIGLIDASEFTAQDGTPYLLWKEDGNAVGQPTPIHAQKLAADGLSLLDAPATLITNDQPWEGALVEGPWVLYHAGYYYLFYSGNAYYDNRYAVGVARATSPLGPYQKMPSPIVTSGSAWVGPGHCSVVDTPAGDTYMIYHAWEAGHANAAPGRLVLVDAVDWVNGWPQVFAAPSSASRPLPSR